MQQLSTSPEDPAKRREALSTSNEMRRQRYASDPEYRERLLAASRKHPNEFNWSATIESRTRGKGAGNRFPKILNVWRSITNIIMPTKLRERLKNHDFAYLIGCTSGLWGLKTERTVCNGVPTSPSSTRRRNHTTVNIARPARVVPSCVSDKR